MPDAKSRYGAEVHLMYLNSIRRIDVNGLEKPARCVGGNGDGTEVKGPILLTNLLEGAAVAGVPSKPEALGFAQDCPAAPQGLVLVSEAGPGAGVLQRQGTCLQHADQAAGVWAIQLSCCRMYTCLHIPTHACTFRCLDACVNHIDKVHWFS